MTAVFPVNDMMAPIGLLCRAMLHLQRHGCNAKIAAICHMGAKAPSVAKCGSAPEPVRASQRRAKKNARTRRA